MPRRTTLTWITLVLIGGVFLLVGFLDRIEARNVYQAASDRYLYSTLPTIADFIDQEIVRGARVRFASSQPVVVHPGLYFAWTPADVIESDLRTGTGRSPQRLASVRIQAFHADYRQEPRSVELDFTFFDTYEPQRYDGEWRELYLEARSKGELRTVWKGLEVNARTDGKNDFRITLRGPWPLPYYHQAHDHMRDRRDHKSQDPKRIRRTAAMVAACIEGAHSTYDYQWGRSGAWVVKRNGDCFEVKASLSHDDRVNVHIAPFNHIDSKTVDHIMAALDEIDGFETSASTRSFSYPKDANPQAVIDQLRRSNRKSRVALANKNLSP